MVVCSCGNPNCKILGKKVSTASTQTVNDITPSTIVVSRSPSPISSTGSQSSRSQSPSRSRSPSPTRKRKRKYSRRACRYIMLNASKKLCYPRYRRKYANAILKKKSKKKRSKKKKAKKVQ